MDGYELVRLLLVCHNRPRFERNETVVVSGHHDFGCQLGLDQLFEPRGNVQNKFLFGITSGPDAAGIMASVSGVDNNARKFETQTPDQRPGSGVRRLCRRDDLRFGVG